jgi:hypothetical protein
MTPFEYSLQTHLHSIEMFTRERLRYFTKIYRLFICLRTKVMAIILFGKIDFTNKLFAIRRELRLCIALKIVNPTRC